MKLTVEEIHDEVSGDALRISLGILMETIKKMDWKFFSFPQARSFFVRLKYPVSLPEEVAQALGIEIANSLDFEQVLSLLTSPHCTPKTLTRFMPREQAENAFQGALRKDCFPQSSLFSFYFPKGWLEFDLQFDSQSRLRRLYIHHRLISFSDGLEIPLR